MWVIGVPIYSPSRIFHPWKKERNLVALYHQYCLVFFTVQNKCKTISRDLQVQLDTENVFILLSPYYSFLFVVQNITYPIIYIWTNISLSTWIDHCYLVINCVWQTFWNHIFFLLSCFIVFSIVSKSGSKLWCIYSVNLILFF